MAIIILALAQGLILATVGAAVRVQYSLYRGFDIIIAPLVVLTAEAFVVAASCFPRPTILAFVVCSAVAISVGAGLSLLWNYTVDRLWRGQMVLGSAILIFSLGASTFITGAVGFGRGPGLRQVDWNLPNVHLFGIDAGLPTAYAIVCGLASCGCLYIWARRRTGFAFELWAQNQLFASEIGISRRSLLPSTSICTGILCGIAGAYGAIANGSTPEWGLTVFLYGAGAALLFPSPLLTSAIKGGLAVGALLVLSQLVFSPSAATIVLFGLITLVLLARGSSRLSQGLR